MEGTPSFVANGNPLNILPRHLLSHIVTEYLSTADISRLGQTCVDFNRSLCNPIEPTDSFQQLWKTLYQRDISKLRLPPSGDYREAYRRIMEDIRAEIKSVENDWDRLIDPAFAYVTEHGYEQLVHRYLRLLSYNPAQIMWGLYAVSQYGYLDLVQSLLDLYPTSINGALIYASNGDHREIVEYLLIRGATNLNGAIEGASYRGHQEMVHYLISKGATNIGGALQHASYRGHRSLVEYLLSYSQISREMIISAIFDAVIRSHDDIADLLRSHLVEHN